MDLVKVLRIPRKFYLGGQWNLIIELPQYWENRLLEVTNKPVCTRTQEKGTVTPNDIESDLPVSVQQALAET